MKKKLPHPDVIMCLYTFISISVFLCMPLVFYKLNLNSYFAMFFTIGYHVLYWVSFAIYFEYYCKYNDYWR